MFTAVSSDIFREVPDRVQIDTTQKRQKTTENQNAMGRQPSLSRTDVVLTAFFWTKLWALKADILRWTNLYFGWSVFKVTFSIIADNISDKGTQLGNAVELAVIVAVWVLLYRHLKIVMSSNASSNGMNSKKALLLFGGIILAVLAFY